MKSIMSAVCSHAASGKFVAHVLTDIKHAARHVKDDGGACWTVRIHDVPVNMSEAYPTRGPLRCYRMLQLGARTAPATTLCPTPPLNRPSRLHSRWPGPSRVPSRSPRHAR